jgi:succinyl-diaminopimelate desuccinylase
VADWGTDVQAWLDERAEDMAALLNALVRVPTENPPGRELGRCAVVLRDALERMGFSRELIKFAPTGSLEGPAIVRGTVGGGAQLVYYHGHFDVVPAQSPSQFEPQRRDGKIIGRGTADMKGGVVSMLYGAAAASELGLLDDGTIVFTSSATRRPAAPPAPGICVRPTSSILTRSRCSPPSRPAA